MVLFPSLPPHSNKQPGARRRSEQHHCEANIYNMYTTTTNNCPFSSYLLVLPQRAPLASSPRSLLLALLSPRSTLSSLHSLLAPLRIKPRRVVTGRQSYFFYLLFSLPLDFVVVCSESPEITVRPQTLGINKLNKTLTGDSGCS